MNLELTKIKLTKHLRRNNYFEHFRTTMFATGERSCIQLIPDGEFAISSKSSLRGLRLLSNHLKDPSLTRPSSIFLVLFATAISIFPCYTRSAKHRSTNATNLENSQLKSDACSLITWTCLITSKKEFNRQTNQFILLNRISMLKIV